MTNTKDILKELESKGSESVKKILLKHGVQEPFFGVKVEDLKPIQKRIKKDYQLSKELYNTGNADAMYLAGLIADEETMSKDDLSSWVLAAKSANISEYTVPWIAAESKFGYELAIEWIDAQEEFIVAAGWSTLSNLAAIKSDEELDINNFKQLLSRVEKTIHESANRVKYTMNAFVIATGTYIKSLTDDAIAVAHKIGVVEVDMGGTACKVPNPITYIEKVKSKGSIGKKKKKARC